VAKNKVTRGIRSAVKAATDKVGGLADDVMKLASGETVYERIVPVPDIDTYSELPFRKVGTAKTAGDDVQAARSATKTKKTAAKKATKKTAARKSPRKAARKMQ